MVANRIDSSPGTDHLGPDADETPSRLLRLNGGSTPPPIWCWPGLGGHPTSLRPLSSAFSSDRCFYGVRAYGVDDGETPHPTLATMVAEDVRAIRRVQPTGPYTLWGYSFGARLAFEVAYQLEHAGEQVDQLVLIAPGSPKLPRHRRAPAPGAGLAFRDPDFVTSLFSVFTGTINDPALPECLAVTSNEAIFIAFMADRFGDVDPAWMRRIIDVARRSYQFHATAPDLDGGQVRAPVTVVRPAGDEESFLDRGAFRTATPPTVIDVDADHHSLLKQAHVDALARAVRDHAPTARWQPSR